MKNSIKEYMIIKNEDGTETKELTREIFLDSAPTRQEIYKQYLKRRRICIGIYLSLNIIIITILMYYYLKFK
ncbi:hypothetical protein SAMN02745163_02092 [Clostridium cavendishii DSM 21758]|uniref:Uncharacterized protein n=1 Tax=Clostridium cavendishii DSM 21758 TaxID=1121302 RepID=A0A1M6K485_9CLOT|nr:hypothetical protein [Clostridium cavendishii]SHJ53738.1 hypothetical protein SAMN02745163_02092 [Clostridium cavendishii DSM 21758]